MLYVFISWSVYRFQLCQACVNLAQAFNTANPPHMANIVFQKAHFSQQQKTLGKPGTLIFDP